MPNKNVGIAFALVSGAGAATAIGAAVVFFPKLVKYTNRKTLAGALGLSAGVMTYVSFVEIFQKSLGSFQDANFSDKQAYLYATCCFFGGVVFMVTLNYLVTALLRGQHHHHHSHGSTLETEKKSGTNSLSYASAEAKHDENENDDKEESDDDKDKVVPCACCSDDPAKDLETMKHMAEVMEHKEEQKEDVEGHDRAGHSHEHNEHCMHADEAKREEDEEEGQSQQIGEDEEEKQQQPTQQQQQQHHEEAKLMRMSINTALAIGLHNFPEGLATFVATLNDPKVGVVLAVAIAIHNIPEGLCVAMPIYYATGNRWKAFAWACLSGASEPVAALLGWAVLANSFSDTLYAILFGLVAGMMVIISARELLPTAHRYDPEDSVVTYSFIVGMFIMALSLVLFVI